MSFFRADAIRRCFLSWLRLNSHPTLQCLVGAAPGSEGISPWQGYDGRAGRGPTSHDSVGSLAECVNHRCIAYSLQGLFLYSFVAAMCGRGARPQRGFGASEHGGCHHDDSWSLQTRRVCLPAHATDQDFEPKESCC